MYSDLGFSNFNYYAAKPTFADENAAFGLNGSGLGSYSQAPVSSNLGAVPWEAILAFGTSIFANRNQSGTQPSYPDSQQIVAAIAAQQEQQRKQALQRNMLIGGGVLLFLLVLYLLFRKKK